MNTILLTGTIAPNINISNLSITDSNLRYNQYINNIIQYFSFPEVKNIIFCENSGYLIKDKKLLEQLAIYYNKNIEILQFIGDTVGVIQYGRGYGEQEILEYALVNSKILTTSQHFFKITGRYYIHNLNYILQRCNKTQKNGIFFTSMSPREKRCSTAFFGCPVTFFKDYLVGCKNNINDNMGPRGQIEGIYANILKSTKQQIHHLPLLPIISANTGSGYLLKPNIIKDNIKQICNYLGFYYI